MLKLSRILLVILFVLKTARLQGILKPPVVRLHHGGSLRGTNFYSTTAKPIDAFLGIAYAEPPLGQLRFSDPRPIHAWHDTKEATTTPPACMQIDLFGSSRAVFGSEDCLYLNVYTPRDRSAEPALPVMVYFHGGGYLFGSSNPVNYGPERLVSRKVVLVTVNYRLGPLGFLSTANSFSPGNYGLKDQNMALKWVQEHISNFGGNPNDVTIFGQSAGAASVSLHLIAPPSQGLFHKAILQSGNYYNPWAITPEQKAIDRARQLAHFVSCPVPIKDNYQKMMKCLRQIDATEIIGAQTNFFVFSTGDPATIFTPVIEPESSNAFLSKHPKDITSSYGDEVPIIIGCNANEGAFKSGPIIKRYPNLFEYSFDTFIPIAIGYDDLSLKDQQKTTRRIKNYYFKNGFDFSINENARNLTNFFSDIAFFAGMEQFLKQRRKTARADTYAYIFDHNPPKSASEFYGGGTDFYGVSHEDELPFLFPFGQLGLLTSKRDLQMVSTMTKMWTDFAKVGNPTPKNSRIVERWKRVRDFPYRYAQIGSKYVRENYRRRNDNRKTVKEKEEDAIPPKVKDEKQYSNRTKRYTDSFESDENDYMDVERTASLCRRSKKGRCKNKSGDTQQNEENSVFDDKTRGKHRERRYKRCHIYSRKSSACFILKNRSNRFWSGFYYRKDETSIQNSPKS